MHDKNETLRKSKSECGKRQYAVDLCYQEPSKIIPHLRMLRVREVKVSFAPCQKIIHRE
jgi:hypothetical protein